MRFLPKNNKGELVIGLIIAFIIIIVFICLTSAIISGSKKLIDHSDSISSYKTQTGETRYVDTSNFNILMSSENKFVGDIIQNQFPEVNIDYADTFEAIDILNKGIKYDALMISNSIWNYKISSEVSLKSSISTGITPVVYGIKKSKAEELGFVNNRVYTRDIIDAINNKGLKFIMGNPTTTNSGASAYFALLYTLADYPIVLTQDHLDDVGLQDGVKNFFMGQERTVGNNDFLKESFLNGDYEAVVAYEHSLLDINKELESAGRETLYIVYPYDGCAICDNTFAYIDNKDQDKFAAFEEIQKYLTSNDGKIKLQEHGLRTWYGGTSAQVDKNVFNPLWGVDTTKYVNAVKFPDSKVINSALFMYQSQFRKPVHVVFCLDYSGSMTGQRFKDLREAMAYILDEEKAGEENIQFSSKDVIDILPFTEKVQERVTTNNGVQTDNLLRAIDSRSPYGGTAIYDAAIEALHILKNEDRNERNVSVILMTDGEANVGSFFDLEKVYNDLNVEIPIYSIVFGDASHVALKQIADLTNGKIFDGKTDLVNAFKEVRGYN